MSNMPGLAKQPGPDQIGETYMCMFCSSRSNEKLPVGGCAGCGTAWPYGEVRALRALQITSGLLFLVFAVFCFYFSAVALQDIFQAEKMSWGIVALLAVLTGMFAAGGMSSLLGKSWLLRLLLIFFGVSLRRRSRPRGKQ